MNTLNRILTKSIVKPFYQANAGFFLVTLGLLFGFLKTAQHIDIATAMAYHPVYYLIPLSLWALYAFKTLEFCKNIKRTAVYQFLTYLSLVKRSKRRALMFSTQAMLLAPVLGYSVLLAFIAAKENQWLSVMAVLTINGVVLILSASRLNKLLTTAVDSNNVVGLSTWTNKLPKPFPTLFIHQLFNRQAVLLLGTKLISLMLVAGFIMIYDMEGTDLRLISLGLLLSGGVNAIFSFHHRQFEQGHLLFFRNLPMSPDSWFWKSLLTFILLSLPEILVLYLNSAMSVSPLFLIENTLLPVALLCFYHAICYARPVNIEQFTKYPFFSTAILFFVILGKVAIVWIVLTLLVSAWVLFRSNFRNFELSQNA